MAGQRLIATDPTDAPSNQGYRESSGAVGVQQHARSVSGAGCDRY
jgi:LysM repeat protein